MATSEDLKKWEEQYGKANDGGIDIVDSQGNVIGNAQYSETTGVALANNADFFQQEDGSFSTTPWSSVTMDKDTGEITVKVPQVYIDRDPTLASFVDKSFFNQLSSNYQADNNIEYVNPYNTDENINTEKYIEMINEAITDRVNLNGALDKTRNMLASKIGGTPEKDAVINSLTPENLVTMDADGTGDTVTDETMMSIPKYLSDAFPKIKELASFDNDFLSVGDFKSWYNLSGEGSLSKEQAVDIEKSIGRALSDVEHLTPDELARTIALGNYLSANDPSISFFDATMTNIGETITGWNEGLWGGVAETIDLLVNAISLPTRGGLAITQGVTTGDYSIPTLPVKEFLWPEDKAFVPDYNEQLEIDSYINSGGLTALGIGRTAGTIAEMGAEMALTSALTSALKAKTVSKMLEKGSETVAKDLAKETITAAAREPAAYERPLIGEATRGARQGTTYAEKMNVFNENFGKTASKLGKMNGGVEMFSNLLKNAESLTADVLKITDAQLMMLDASQLTKVAESAYKIVRNASYASKAIGVMSTFVTTAITFNKDLTDKIVRDPTAPGELKTWVKQMAWDSAFIGAQGLAIKGAGKFGSFIHSEVLAGTKIEAAYNKASAGASKAARGVKNAFSKPYRSLRNWLTDRKLEAQAVRKQGIKNSTLANEQALKEAEVVAEARAFTQSQSITPNEAGYAVRNTTTGETARFGSFSEAMGTQYYDPITMTSSRISPFQAATANEARLDNLFTVSEDIQQQEATLIHQFSDPDVEPIISGQINVAAEVDTSLLNMEYEAGMLSKTQQKTSAKLQKAAKKSPYEILNAGHSREVVVFARRQQELEEVVAKSEANGVPLDETNLEYQDALKRRDTAAEGVPVQIRNHITTQVLPAYRELEHSIVDYAIDPKHAVMNSEIVNAMRESGEWGKDGRIYLRAAAAKDIPKGSYIPKDRFAMMDSTIGEHHSKILEEKDITWIGNGLNAMIREIASASAYKRLWEANKAYADVTIAITGEETMAAEALKGYKTDFQKEVVKGLGSIKEDMSKSMAVDKLTGSKGVVSEEGGVVGELPAGKQPKLLEKPPIILEADIEHTRAAGLGFMEPVEIRTTMSDNGLITSDYIANQETFEAFYKQSSDAGKKVLRDNFSNDIIADYRAYLNSQVPGFDVLDWSLLGRQHTNGLYPGGLYTGMDDPVSAYIMDLNDLRKLTGFDRGTKRITQTALDRVEQHINTRDKGAILPIRYNVNTGNFQFRLRWYSGNFQGEILYPDWGEYLNYLEEKGITKVPIAVTAYSDDIGREAVLRSFVDEIDDSLATGAKPKLSPEDIAIVMSAGKMSKASVHKKLKAVMPAEEASALVDDAGKLIEEVSERVLPEETGREILEDRMNAVLGPAANVQDITKELRQAQADYGYIPWFHSQHKPLGSAEFNEQPPTGDARYTANNGVGDALWVAPNSSYTKMGGYGGNQTIANIPKEYFMSDKELQNFLYEADWRLQDLGDKAEKKISSQIKKISKTEGISEASARAKLMDGQDYSKFLSKKDAAEFQKLDKIFAPGGEDVSFRAIAEYTGKPVIDTTLAMNNRGIDGTAFFYYKGASPEFDKELGRQLEIQATGTPDNSDAMQEAILEQLQETVPFPALLEDLAGNDSIAKSKLSDIKRLAEDIEGTIYSDSRLKSKIESELDDKISELIDLRRGAMPGLAEYMSELKQHNLYSTIDEPSLAKWVLGKEQLPELVHVWDLSQQEYDDLVEMYDLGEYISPGEKEAWAAIDPTNPANVPDSGYMKRNMVDYEKLTDLRNKNYAKTQAVLDDVDRLNAYEQLPQDAKKVTQAGEEYNKIAEEFWIDNIYDMDFSYEVEPPKTEKPKGKRGDNLKYKLDEEKLLEDVDHAIDNMVDVVYSNPVARIYMDSANTLGRFKNSASRKQFVILSEILSSKNKDVLDKTIDSVAKSIIKNAIPPKKAVIKGNLDSLELKMKKLIRDRLESRLSKAQRTLVDAGEEATSETINELLKKYNEEITGYAEDDKYIKTTDEAGRVIWAKVSPAFGAVFNKRTIFRPMGTVQSAVANMALLKRISLTNINPRSFSKQAASDSAMAFVTTGFVPVPGLYTATSKAIAAEFGESIAAQIEKFNPRRYQNIKMVAEREGVSIGEAAVKNMNAIAESKLPFTTMSQEFFRQTNINQYGGNAEEYRKTLNERINEWLRKASEVLGKPNDVRELWTRKGAGVQEMYNRLKQGFNYAQAEEFRQFATNNATTNFQQKHAIFNALRHTVPYLTAGVSGFKSFWKMFELDPIGVTTRIWVGFIIPIMWLMGEVMEDEDVKKQYEQLSEEEKSNHIIINVNGQLTRIPIGEELGSIVNPINHIIETLHNENKYDFWSLMLNDAVNFLPADFTGFTDPEMWNSIAGQAPSFLEAMDNGISKLLSSTMPPFLQSTYMAVSGRDLYTGKKIDTNRLWIDDEGNLQIQSYSQSQFSQALAKLVGGDAGVIEKVTSGLVGTTLLHVLDTLTSAGQYVLSGGKEGSLSTAITKAADDMANPYAVHGYDSLGKQFSREAKVLQDKKEKIETSKDYRAYNEAIAKEKDAEKRRKMINQRNGLLIGYQESVEAFLKEYKRRGGVMDGLKFSKATQLLVFEDALRADRSHLHITTEKSDARAQALNSLREMGITNPDGPSMIGYIAKDSDGNTYLKTWTPSQMQIIENSLNQQGNIHAARIKAIVEDGGDRSIKKQLNAEKDAEQPYWDKYNSGKKLTSAEWDKIDELREAYNNQVLLALKDYLNTYGPKVVLNNDKVQDYLEDIIQVPSAYETVNNRFVSSGGGKLNKKSGFVESYTKALFGVK